MKMELQKSSQNNRFSQAPYSQVPKSKIQTKIEDEFHLSNQGFTMIATGKFFPWAAGDHRSQLQQAKRRYAAEKLNFQNSSIISSNQPLPNASKINFSHQYIAHGDMALRSNASYLGQLRSRGEDKKSHLNDGLQKQKNQLQKKYVVQIEERKFMDSDDEDEYQKKPEIHEWKKKDQLLEMLPKARQQRLPELLSKARQQRVEDSFGFGLQKLQRMYKFPAGYREAMVHNKACRYGYPNATILRDDKETKQLGQISEELKKQILSVEYQKVPVCPCCENRLSNIEIPLQYSTKPQGVQAGKPKFLLQTGVAMYFLFIKAVIMYLTLRLLIFDIANIIFSMNGHYCPSVQNSTDACAFTIISGYNLNTLQDQKALDYLDYFNLGLTILSIIYFYFNRKHQASLMNWLDRSDISQKDFSILVEDIPLLIYENKDTSIQQINYNHEDILKNQIQKYIRQWLKAFLENVVPKTQNSKHSLSFQDYVDENKILQDFNFPDRIENHFCKFVFKRKIREQINEIKNYKLGSAHKKFDYSKIGTNEQLIKHVKDIITQRQIVVPDITLCYDLTQFESLNKIRKDLTEIYIKQKEGEIIDAEDPSLQQKLVKHIPTQIYLLNQQYIDLCRRLAVNPPPSFRLSHFTGKAIVSFQYKHYRDYLLTQFEAGKCPLNFNQKPQKLSPINKPQDIYWQNMKVTDDERTKYYLYSYAILTMLLILSFASILGLQYWQRVTQLPANTQSLWDKIVSNLFSVAMAILTFIINYILSFAICLLADMQRHKTKSDRLNSLVFKMIVTQTFNTAFIYFILYLITPINPLGKAGLVKNVFNLVLVSGFINVAYQFFSPIYMLKKLYYYFKYVGKQRINMFQVQLNELLQQPEFKFADMYSNYIVFTFVVSFYGFIAPTATPVLIVIFCLQYWVDKYNLFRRYSCPVDFGAELIKKIFIMFQASLLIFALGQFYWDLQMHKDQSPEFRVLSIANLTIASIFVLFELFAPNSIKRKVFDFQKVQCYFFSYNSCQKADYFKKTYFRENPATSCLKKSNQKYKANQQKGYEGPKFVKPDPLIYQKYLNLSQKRKLLYGYDQIDKAYYDQKDQQDIDETKIERQFKNKYKDSKDQKAGNLIAFIDHQENVNRNLSRETKVILNGIAQSKKQATN